MVGEIVGEKARGGVSFSLVLRQAVGEERSVNASLTGVCYLKRF